MTDITEQILGKLYSIEDEHEVHNLMAIESGSRAWGFASPDSDYDVRFIYVKGPKYYQTLNLFPKVMRPDTISYTPDKVMDFHGWDLLKALKMLQKSNPSLHEWLKSPICYMGSDNWIESFRNLSDRWWSPVASFHHYRHMAHTNFREYLQGPEVRYKKYLYVIRPLLAAQFVVKFRTQPPINFDDLVSHSDLTQSMFDAIENLLELKRSSTEITSAPVDPVLHQFIELELARRPDPFGPSDIPSNHVSELADFFLDVVNM